MLLKTGETFFNHSTTGMRKLVSDTIGTWTASGQPLNNIAALKAQADAIITSNCYNKWNNYKVALNNGSIYNGFKGYIMNMYSFATFKYGMNAVGAPPFAYADPTINSTISWEFYDMGIPSIAVTNNWFTYTVPTFGTLPVAGTLVVSSAVSAYGLTLEGRITIDIDAMTAFATTISTQSADRMIYLTFSPSNIIPPEKPVSEIVKVDYGVTQFCNDMGWSILGINS